MISRMLLLFLSMAISFTFDIILVNKISMKASVPSDLSARRLSRVLASMSSRSASVVNLALITHRRRFPTLERPFRVPLVPLLPALGILANLYLIVIQVGAHPIPFSAGLATLAIGWALYLVSSSSSDTSSDVSAP